MAQQLSLPGQLKLVNTTITLDENATVPVSPTAGQGAIWVKNDTPSSLYFTDDTGTDYDLTATGSSPGGSNTQIQYNNSGVFGGDSGFTTNGTGAVNITGDLDVDNLNLNGNTITSTDTNGNLLFDTNGNGAIAVRIASSDARGTNAVDFQFSRASDNQVASGNNSFLAGGSDNRASGNDSFATGSNNTANATAAFAVGTNAIANVQNQIAHGMNFFSNAGDAQTCQYLLKAVTTDATQTEVLGGNSEQLVLPNDSTWSFDITVTARRTDADGESAIYRIHGGIDRQTNAASTALIGTVTKEVNEDTAAWDVTVDADTTNGALRIRATGQAAKDISWLAFVRTVEVTG